MQVLKEKIINITRISLWYLDYFFYILTIPFFYKKLPKNPKNILVIELLYIGDLIVTTPTIRALKKRFPNSKITIMVLEEMKEVLSDNPNIDEILTISMNENFDSLSKKLKNKFDIGIILHPNPKIGSYKISKFLIKSKVKYRIGCTAVGIRESRGFFLNKKTVPTLKTKHKIEDNLDVIKSLIKSKDKRLEIYTNAKLNLPKEYIVIHPFSSSHPTWFKKRFAELADKLYERYKIPIFFTGNLKEKEKINEIISLMKNKAIFFTGTIKEFFSIIKTAKFIISSDTSTIHIASAFNKPLIALFGPSNPKVWAPLNKNSFIIFKNKEAHTSCVRSNCYFKNDKHLECLKKIQVDEIIELTKKYSKQ